MTAGHHQATTVPIKPSKQFSTASSLQPPYNPSSNPSLQTKNGTMPAAPLSISGPKPLHYTKIDKRLALCCLVVAVRSNSMLLPLL